jgi:HEAT repeat protein
MASAWGVTPRHSVEAECGRRGRRAVVAGCIDLLEGDYTDDNLLRALGGPMAQYVLDGHEGPYWFRVWAARGLLYAWDESAAPAVTRATSDESWRVREMATRVIVRHRVGDALHAVAGLRSDPVARVRAAAERALVVLTEARA